VTPLKCFIAGNVFGSYCVPASSQHRPAAQAILAGEIWEAKTLAFLTNNCGSGDIVHAGTYFGDFLPALSQAVTCDARIWAFEPSTENYLCAEITLRLNAITNVVLTHAALGAEASEALLCTGAEGRRSAGGGSTIVTEKRDGLVYENARVRALDDAVPPERHVSVLQLDVEKYEQQALAGALSIIRRCRPLLVLETLPADPSWCAANILSLGYEKTGRLDTNYVLRTRAKS
jgi:FkbM family methyltransferase